jgi:RNA polymerase-binding transcription factor DksA
MDTPTAAQLRRLHHDLSNARAALATALRHRFHEGGAELPLHLHGYLAEQRDAAETSDEQADELAWLGHEAAALRQTDAALRRLAAGRYGTCTQCGLAIPVERLLAMPSAERCLACQTAAEQSAAPGTLARPG